MRTTTADLVREVEHARSALRRVRQAPGTRVEAMEARRADLVVALLAYTGRLTADGMPVPTRLRDELRLHSALCDAGTQGRARDGR